MTNGGQGGQSSCDVAEGLYKNLGTLITSGVLGTFDEAFHFIHNIQHVIFVYGGGRRRWMYDVCRWLL